MATTSPKIGSPISPSSKLPQSHCVNAHHSDDRETERNKRKIEHDRLLAHSPLSAEPCKVSMRDWLSRRNDSVRPLRSDCCSPNSTMRAAGGSLALGIAK